MARPPNGEESNLNQEADFAQAFKELARGEQTATALEKHLDTLEQKIEELLVQAEENQRNTQAHSERSRAVEAAHLQPAKGGSEAGAREKP